MTCLGSCVQVVNAWLKCFHAVVPLLDKSLIKAKILPVALAKGANDETSVQSRVICCAMLGSMAACLTKVSQTNLPATTGFHTWAGSRQSLQQFQLSAALQDLHVTALHLASMLYCGTDWM